MEIILSLFFLSIIALTAYSPKWGILVMLVSYILLPEIPFTLLGGGLKKNHLLIFVLFVFYVRYVLKDRIELDISPFKFCLIYFFLSLLCIPYKIDTSYSMQFYYLVYDVAIILFFPIAIWNIISRENCLVLFRNALLSCICIACVYGLFLTLTNGLNPLVILFSSFGGGGLDEEAWTQYFSDENRMFGRISSVFFHPMSYASFLGFSALYVYYIRDTISKRLFVFLSIIILANILVCGVRSVIGALLVTLFVYVVLKRNTALTIRIMIFLMLGILVISAIPPLFDYVSSIFSKSDDVGGSSIEMRLEQLAGAFDEISDNIFMGKGYGWSRDYIVQFKNHPILLGFESIIFVLLCNNGLIGLFLFGLFVFLYYKNVLTNVAEDDRAFFLSLIVFYVSYETITGEFAFQHFILFYTVLLCESLRKYQDMVIGTEPHNFNFNFN